MGTAFLVFVLFRWLRSFETWSPYIAQADPILGILQSQSPRAGIPVSTPQTAWAPQLLSQLLAKKVNSEVPQEARTWTPSGCLRRLSLCLVSPQRNWSKLQVQPSAKRQ